MSGIVVTNYTAKVMPPKSTHWRHLSSKNPGVTAFIPALPPPAPHNKTRLPDMNAVVAQQQRTNKSPRTLRPLGFL